MTHALSTHLVATEVPPGDVRDVPADDPGAWVNRAACRTGDPERLFVQGAAQRAAVSICRGCPVTLQCLADALDNRVEFGVWGGLTERERRQVLRDRPDVESWRTQLLAVRGHERLGAG